jgi:hypothetical protein
MRRSFDTNDKPDVVESRKQSVNQTITKTRKMRVVAGESNARFKFSIPVNHFVRFFLNCEIRPFLGWRIIRVSYVRFPKSTFTGDSFKRKGQQVFPLPFLARVE